jgi:hypothetical protein
MNRTLIAIVNLLISVAVPLAITAASPDLFSAGESYLLGVLLFIALTTLEIYVLADQAFKKELRLGKIWDARQRLDSRLQEVRRLFHDVEEHKVGEPDLFVYFFNKKLGDLESTLRDASSKQEIRIDETMLEVTTWLYNSSFHGRDEDIFCAIHFTSDNAFFFDVHARRYFSQAFQLVESGRIKGVRRILIFADAEELEEDKTRKLIAFHQNTDGYDCRTLSRPIFERIVRDYALHHLVKDFGIYGRSYLYKGVVNRVDEIEGYYSRDKLEINRFIDCFQTCWETGQEPRPVDVNAKVTMDWLFTAGQSNNIPSVQKGTS